MISVNLLPSDTQASATRASKLRMWAIVCALEAVGLGAAGWMIGPKPAAADQAARRVAHGQERLREARDGLAAASKTHLALTQQAETASRLTKPRVWSPLLAFLAERIPHEVMLSALRVETTETEPDNAATAAPAWRKAEREKEEERPRGVLHVSGLAADHRALAALLKTLSECALFRSVRLGGTKREPFLSGHAMDFSVICTW